MSSDSSILKCEHCDYKTNRPYNLKRHLVTKHSGPKENILGPKENITRTNTNQCDKCTKSFKKRTNYTKHIEKCKGLNYDPLVCEYCSKIFGYATSKYRHLKICKVKAEVDSKALVTVQLQPQQCIPPCISSEGNTTITNAHTVNNTIVNSTTTTSTSTNNSNNRITNIIVYKPDMEFLNDHIKADKLLQWLNSYDHETTMKSYSREIMSRPENRFVKKTNLRSSTSSVHVGENNWEMRLDKELYPEIMCTIANGFSLLLEDKVTHAKSYRHILTDHARKRMYKSLDAFIDYMASNGYCNDRDDDKVKHVATFFNTLVKELKIMAFNYTRPTSS